MNAFFSNGICKNVYLELQAHYPKATVIDGLKPAGTRAPGCMYEVLEFGHIWAGGINTKILTP